MNTILIVLAFFTGIALVVSIFAILVASAAWNEIKKLKEGNGSPSAYADKKPFIKQDPRTHMPYANPN